MESLRLERCGECLGLFSVCRSCFRGQRYCGPACRSKGRRRVVRAARARHQRSEEGRLDHRDRQRAYRQRRRSGKRPGVTDPGSQPEAAAVECAAASPPAVPAVGTPERAEREPADGAVQGLEEACATPLLVEGMAEDRRAVQSGAAAADAGRPAPGGGDVAGGVGTGGRSPWARCVVCQRASAYVLAGAHRRQRPRGAPRAGRGGGVAGRAAGLPGARLR